MNSFRLRIALANAIVSGMLLVSLAGASLFILYNLKVSDLRKDIAAFERRGFPVLRHSDEYQKFGYNLEMDRRQSGEPHLSILMKDRAGMVVFKSETWPEGVSPNSFPENPLPIPPGPLRIGEQRPGENPIADEPPWRNESFAHPAPVRPVLPPHQLPGPQSGRAPYKLAGIQKLGSSTSGYLLGVFHGPNLTVGISASLEAVYGEVRSIAYAFFLILPVALMLLLATSYWLSGKAIKPVRDLTLATESIDAQSLQERVVLQNADREFRRLAEVFNDMLARLQKSFEQSKRFSSDAAHELKTPLAILQGELELAIQQCEEGSPLQQKLSELTTEILNLNQIISKLLYLSQADAGKLPVSRERFNLSTLVRDIAADEQLTAPDIRFTTDLDAEVWIEADPLLVGQIIHNLVSNAIRYNRQDGSIFIHLRAANGLACLDIQNTGPAIPDADAGRIFERFYRARHNDVSGSGLGLSLAREFARAHNGQLMLRDNAEDQICFRLSLPIGEESPRSPIG